MQKLGKFQTLYHRLCCCLDKCYPEQFSEQESWFLSHLDETDRHCCYSEAYCAKSLADWCMSNSLEKPDSVLPFTFSSLEELDMQLKIHGF